MGSLRSATTPTGPGFTRLAALLIGLKVGTESNLLTLRYQLDQVGHLFRFAYSRLVSL